MLGGVSVVCSECSNQWTVSPAVSRSWFCPECGGTRDVDASAKFCQCGHVYGKHRTAEGMNPSRAAFGISVDELDQLERILNTEPEPEPFLGGCALCDCSCFRLVPPHLSPKEFLRTVKLHLDRGMNQGKMVATVLDDSTLLFARGSRTIRLRIRSGTDGVVDFEALETGEPTRTFVMGRATVGECCIAIAQTLNGMA